MKSAEQIAETPAGIPIVADDILEFHAARLLLLLSICGTAGRIDGLTKMAKLDFFVRYPTFFSEAVQHEGQKVDVPAKNIEATMVRHHYGPWDQRYYQILAYLEGRGLIIAQQNEAQFQLGLTEKGKQLADIFKKNSSFKELCLQMKEVKKVFGHRSGNSLKKLIYSTFDKEVADRALGEIIQ